ncbi:CHAT domain-containing protein, partial [Streptomyces sp. H39-S7]|uniref:CHAT domain-containing protein n=1 Tax=Streptomyces sp. H39-S7 TaxID=3004357 RepID=UPI0022AFF179
PTPVTAGPLPFAEAETRAAAAHFAEARLLTGPSATRAAVLAELPDASVLHFACHGLADYSRPLDSGILLAGHSLLRVRDLMALDFPGRIRTAVLSSCETGVVGTDLPEEVVGLPAGFLQAGVAGVVSSLWSIGDRSTALLMASYYRLLGTEPMPYGNALRAAQIWVRDSTNAEKKAAFPELVTEPAGSPLAHAFWAESRAHDHPVSWAAFTYTGE